MPFSSTGLFRRPSGWRTSDLPR